jgi:hypothetical protein
MPYSPGWHIPIPNNTITMPIVDMDGQRIDKLIVKISDEIKEEMEEGLEQVEKMHVALSK